LVIKKSKEIRIKNKDFYLPLGEIEDSTKRNYNNKLF
jgi:hypothetical protein